MGDKSYEVVLFGATGFTGRLAARYLAGQGGPELRWALAGRNRAKLEAVRAELPSAKVEIIDASIDDPASLAAMARQARVVLTTVGPYERYGEPVVAACVAEGADYVDITGEPYFVARMIERYHGEASARGLRIVPCCGFDSIPADLGVYYTVKRLPSDEPIRVDGFVNANGGFSGGSWQSALTIFSRARKIGQDCRTIAEDGLPDDGRRVRTAPARVYYEPRVNGWALPMPTIDPAIVLRSARAMKAYGPEFRYGHHLRVRTLPKAVAVAAGASTVIGLAMFPPTRALLRKARSSGEGPSAEKRAKGFFRVSFVGHGGGREVVTEMTGGDPGYDETAKMVAESALCLARDRSRLPGHTGVITPALAMGDALVDRLQAAGIAFKVVSGEPEGSERRDRPYHAA